MTTDSPLDQVQRMLSNLSNDIQTMPDASRRHTDLVIGAMNDFAAHMLAIQAIIVAMLKQTPLDADPMMRWIDTRTNTIKKTGSDSEEAKVLARHLLDSTD